MEEPAQGTTTQHERDKEAYTAWKRKNNIARITMLSCMNDDLMCEFEEKRLNQKFNDYKKCSNHSMRQHLRVMSNISREVKNAGQIIYNEQQIQIFKDISCHLELEDERLEATKPFNKANFVKSNW
ncbi:hypothetical protein N665_0945s0002 [Sinapis alba]|nr:hypothetical protein N665_0945s0002 [Sinapis alba]